MSKGSKNIKVIISVFLVAITLIGGFLVSEFNNSRQDVLVDGKMYVDFIDVGQGDCTLIRTSEAVILVDAGEVGSAETVVSYLKENGITKIDCCIATHPHSDHIGALPQVFEEFEVETVIMPDVDDKNEPTSRVYENFLLGLENVENIIQVLGADLYEFSDLKVEILGPLKQYDDLNDMSVVARISYGNTSVMLTGDAEITAEEDMLKIHGTDYSAQLLKVGHHGSRTSTGTDWLNAVNPEYAVISCGYDNDYGHPHKEIIEQFELWDLKYYRTDLVGHIIFESDGRKFNVLEK